MDDLDEPQDRAVAQVPQDRIHSTANAPVARRIVGQFVARYNEVRLHSAIGFVTSKDKLEGRDAEIFAARDRKLEAACAADNQPGDSSPTLVVATIAARAHLCYSYSLCRFSVCASYKR